MMKDKELEMSLKALANRRRLAMIRFIKKNKEASVGDIANDIKLSFKSTSRHLSVMFSAGLLEREQRSLHVFYKLAPNILESIRRIISTL
ncbi:MAG: metalloregulator ArsR/SmtB family transcription factor [bacterium]|nr:metalloregulator ArsR/SmtB family transcription factor [bacterium]